MSVNHYILPVTNLELSSLLQSPKQIRSLIDQKSHDIVAIQTEGVAIVALTASSDDDPLAFILAGAPPEYSGHVGKYEEIDGSATCEIDMGHGPASYYRNSFIRRVAQKLQPLTVKAFADGCNVAALEENGIYPSGWLNPGRKESLVSAFSAYRSCILSTAESGLNLLIWCA